MLRISIRGQPVSGEQLPLFGGEWTRQKLDMLRRYLGAYVKVLKNQHFEQLYIDAFAGTGYVEVAQTEHDRGFFAPELAEDEPQQFFEGSASMALQIHPPFHRYIFIEQSPSRFEKLLRLRDRFARLGDRMEFVQGDANTVLQGLCERWNRGGMRGVLFLDPFGMQVDWTTLEGVARTRAIDVWILFPLGIGVNRLLPRHGKIPDGWRARLTRVFGTDDWYDEFYRPARTRPLFGEAAIIKTGSYNAIADYYQDRLRTVFPAVAANPKVLQNCRGMPLFLLCFAVGNDSPNAIGAALRISEHILGKA